jgi:hypothetical protein
MIDFRQLLPAKMFDLPNRTETPGENSLFSKTILFIGIASSMLSPIGGLFGAAKKRLQGQTVSKPQKKQILEKALARFLEALSDIMTWK